MTPSSHEPTWKAGALHTSRFTLPPPHTPHLEGRCSPYSTVHASPPHTHSTPGRQVLSMREAVFIVSPNTLNLGSLVPMRPVTTGPVCRPTRTIVGLPSWGMETVLEQRRRACGTACMGCVRREESWPAQSKGLRRADTAEEIRGGPIRNQRLPK